MCCLFVCCHPIYFGRQTTPFGYYVDAPVGIRQDEGHAGVFWLFFVYFDVLLNTHQEILTAEPSVVVVEDETEIIAAELELYTRLPSAATNPE